MPTQRREHELTDAGADALRLAFDSDQAGLGIASSPAAEAEKVAVSAAVLLDPLEGDRLVFEAPRLDQVEGLLHLRVCGPHKEHTVVSSYTPPPQG